VLGHNCPHCNAPVHAVNISDVKGMVGFESKWKLIAYSCPKCGKIISIELDPIALKHDIIEGLVQRLRK
jgi:endogenous inhibitor of DNA gyrase (YacG/DUF329 family)